MSNFPLLARKINLGSLSLPNRAIMGSMHTGLEDIPSGFARLGAFYQERIKGGVGLIITGGFSPNKEGRFDAHSATFETETDAEEHKIITDCVHKFGGKILLQILHTGRYGYHTDIVAPSPIQAPINSRIPRELGDSEISKTIEQYVNTAKLAKLAGYDGVEIMGSEGYLINQFIVRHTNKRQDKWGGTYQNRIRFPLEIVKQTRQSVGRDFCIMYRLSMLDLIEDGSTEDENITLAKAIEHSGADVINTGVGWHEARVPTIAQAVPRGGFSWVTAKLMHKISIPLVTTNRINTPEIAEEILSKKHADMVSMARPFLADPEFLNKALNGRNNAINTCIACNQACLDFIFEGKTATCMVNPRAGKETSFNWTRAQKKKKLAVVGCGPAGMAAASILAERGHLVTVFEAADSIGGQFNLAKNIPGKEEFKETIRYFSHQFDSFGVTVNLNTFANKRIIQDGNFDEIILATGIKPRTPDIPGINNSKVATYTEVLENKTKLGKNVIIIGGGGIAFDTALYILEKKSVSHIDKFEFKKQWGIEETDTQKKPNHNIIMIQRNQSKMGQRLGKTTGWIHRAILKKNLVRQICGAKYLGISDAGLLICQDQKKHMLNADTIVICAGQIPNNQQAKEMENLGKPVHKIGGAKESSGLDARRAFEEGARLAAAL